MIGLHRKPHIILAMLQGISIEVGDLRLLRC